MAGQEEMSFWDHLDVLRGTLFRSAAAVVAISIVFLCIKEPLFRIVLWPAQPDFFLYRWLGLDFSMELINIDVSAQFFYMLGIKQSGFGTSKLSRRDVPFVLVDTGLGDAVETEILSSFILPPDFL